MSSKYSVIMVQTSATSADLTFNAVGKTALPSNVTGLYEQ